MTGPNFALYYAGDAYSTDRKIMGRQSAGKALIRGVARRWPKGELHGFGPSRRGAEALLRQLRADGFEGTLRWRQPVGDPVLQALGALYYPAPINRDLAHARNAVNPRGYSLFGVTHTLSSTTAMDGIGELAGAPFRPWDALICTSSVARDVAGRLMQEWRDWQARHMGATRFNTPELPVIPLGVDAPGFARMRDRRGPARQALGLEPDDIVFLFAGRLSFHAKANPAPLYLALERAAQGRRLVCVEAGLHPNVETAASFRAAQAALAPSVRFIHAAGDDATAFADAWSAADVFVSLSDNIQETFGLTPVEAMAAGLPVLVSDWNGYKDTVRDGVDGFRLATVTPPPGPGVGMARRHGLGLDTYDYFVGRVSTACAIDIDLLAERIGQLADNEDLRRRMGAEGQARAVRDHDWPVILDRYVALAARLGEIRSAAQEEPAEPIPMRPDPFALFQAYPTVAVGPDWPVVVRATSAGLDTLLGLDMANYVLEPGGLTAEMIQDTLAAVGEETTARTLIATPGLASPQRWRAMMWLAKFGLVSFGRPKV